MTAYETKTSMIEAYAIKLELDGMAPDIAKMIAEAKPVYVPHIYRGGYVIREFGFSKDRVGKFISFENAGNPLYV